MQVPFVATKITIPPVQRELVPRPRLIERLNQGLRCKLTLVSTPAGYGKTLLLCTWASQSRLPVAWISLDEGDNDPARFFRVLLAALADKIPDLGINTQVLLRSPQFPSPEEFLTSILNEIAQLEGSLVLVLDDYHLIYEPAVHNALIYILNHFPTQMHLVIASRADPPLQIARLRARSELCELRLADLCLTPDEAVQFCNEVMALDLKADEVAVLVSRTEGWIAGLQMAAISLQGSQDKTGRIQSFSGRDRFILDYLAEEVLSGQPEEIQSFLMKTSILARLSGPLCDAVTDLENSQEVLESLERANLFIIPLDEERSWYRYHQLFQDLLGKRVLQRWPGEMAGWQLRASHWFETMGDPDQAIEHALAAGDFERSAGLLETTAETTLMRSEIFTFKSWTSRLPAEILQAHPDLLLFHAWALVLSDAPVETVENQLMWVDSSSERIAGKVSVIRGYLQFMQGEIYRAERIMQQALASLPEDENLFRGVATFMLTNTYVMTGDFNRGSRALEQYVEKSLENGQVILAARALCTLAEIHFRLGQLQEAREDYERVLSFAWDAQGQRLPIAARALVGLGELWREWNDLEQASNHCQEGIDLARYVREGIAVAGYITLARVRQALGDAGGAQAAMQQAFELARRTEGSGLDDAFVAIYRAALNIKQGNLSSVEAWFEQNGLTGAFDPADLDRKEDYYSFHLLKYQLLVLARYWIATDQPKKALSILNRLGPKMEEQGRVHLLIETLFLRAEAYQRRGELEQAMDCFRRALSLAEHGGYVRLFLDEGPAICPLLQEAIRTDTVYSYAGRLLVALETEVRTGEGEGQPSKSSTSLLSGLVEQLTAREIELLQLIADGLSNQEIARRLYISLPTVKWHTSNIYGKLGVRSRTQAVVQARKMGILPLG